jgi:nucleotide-binding universal stress UspA family protein
MFNVKNILLPTDFSKLSLSAAQYAVDLAIQYGAKIHLLHVIEKTPPILTIHSLDLSEEKIIKSIEDDARESLNKTLAKLSGGGAEILTVLKKGLDYDEIVNYSQENSIDVIVIATHGRTGVLHTLIGSVAEKVIRYAKCPVLVITPTGKEK